MESIVKRVLLFLFLHSGQAADDFQCAEFHKFGLQMQKFNLSSKKFPFESSWREYLDAFDNNNTEHMLRLLQNIKTEMFNEEDSPAVDMIQYVVSAEIKLIQNI